MDGDASRAGRRGNGLVAAHWGALVDLDPRLSGTLLDSLAAVGVAAFVEPARPAQDSVTGRAESAGRPLDRLWVDTAHAEQARAVVGAEVAELSALLFEPGSQAQAFVHPVPRQAAGTVLPPPVLPDRPAGDEDEAWRQIVAGWSRDSDEVVPPWPVSEDLPDVAADPPPERRPPRAPEPAARPREEADDDGLPAWVEPDRLDDDGHYEPPAPPAVPRVRRHTVGALIALVLGVVLVFAPNVVGQPPSSGLSLVGILLMGGGAGRLVWQLRDGRGDDGPDDGAVV